MPNITFWTGQTYDQKSIGKKCRWLKYPFFGGWGGGLNLSAKFKPLIVMISNACIRRYWGKKKKIKLLVKEAGLQFNNCIMSTRELGFHLECDKM